MLCSRSLVVALASAVCATAIPVSATLCPHRPVISIAFALPVMLVGVDGYSVSSLFLTTVLLGDSSHQQAPQWGWADLD